MGGEISRSARGALQDHDHSMHGVCVSRGMVADLLQSCVARPCSTTLWACGAWKLVWYVCGGRRPLRQFFATKAVNVGPANSWSRHAGSREAGTWQSARGLVLNAAGQR